MVESAQVASRMKGTYFRSKYYRVAMRRGKKRAVIAVAHKILVGAYYILRDKRGYQDLGEEYLDQRRRNALKCYWVNRLEKLGFQVKLEEEDLEKAA